MGTNDGLTHDPVNARALGPLSVNLDTEPKPTGNAIFKHHVEETSIPLQEVATGMYVCMFVSTYVCIYVCMYLLMFIMYLLMFIVIAHLFLFFFSSRLSGRGF